MKKKIVTFILATAFVASALAACDSSTASSSSSASSTASGSISETETPTPTPAEEVTSTPTEEATSVPSESEASNIPWEYTSALNSAENYSAMMHMSKAGIYDQLTSEYGEKFTAEEADYAVSNLG